MEWWNMDAFKWECEMDMTAFVMDWMTESSFEWAFLLRSEEDEFELMSSTEPIFKLKPRDLRGAVLRGWGPQREVEFCVLSLPTSPHRLDLDCKLTTSFIRERLNDIITQSQPQPRQQDNWYSEQREEWESKSQRIDEYPLIKQKLYDIPNNCSGIKKEIVAVQCWVTVRYSPGLHH